MTLQAENPLEAFQWKRQPEAYAFIRSSAEAFLKSCPPAADLAARMQRETGTRFHDWIDTIWFPVSDEMRETLDSIGYEPGPLSTVKEYNVDAFIRWYLAQMRGGSEHGSAASPLTRVA